MLHNNTGANTRNAYQIVILPSHGKVKLNAINICCCWIKFETFQGVTLKDVWVFLTLRPINFQMHHLVSSHAKMNIPEPGQLQRNGVFTLTETDTYNENRCWKNSTKKDEMTEEKWSDLCLGSPCHWHLEQDHSPLWSFLYQLLSVLCKLCESTINLQFPVISNRTNTITSHKVTCVQFLRWSLFANASILVTVKPFSV